MDKTGMKQKQKIAILIGRKSESLLHLEHFLSIIRQLRYEFDFCFFVFEGFPMEGISTFQTTIFHADHEQPGTMNGIQAKDFDAFIAMSHDTLLSFQALNLSQKTKKPILVLSEQTTLIDPLLYPNLAAIETEVLESAEHVITFSMDSHAFLSKKFPHKQIKSWGYLPKKEIAKPSQRKRNRFREYIGIKESVVLTSIHWTPSLDMVKTLAHLKKDLGIIQDSPLKLLFLCEDEDLDLRDMKQVLYDSDLKSSALILQQETFDFRDDLLYATDILVTQCYLSSITTQAKKQKDQPQPQLSSRSADLFQISYGSLPLYSPQGPVADFFNDQALPIDFRALLESSTPLDGTWQGHRQALSSLFSEAPSLETQAIEFRHILNLMHQVLAPALSNVTLQTLNDALTSTSKNQRLYWLTHSPLRKDLANSPDHRAWFTLKEAECQFDQGEQDRALRLCLQIDVDTVQNVTIKSHYLSLMGFIHLNSGSSDLSLRYFQKAKRMDSTAAKPLMGLALWHQNREEVIIAFEYFKSAFNQDPQLIDTYGRYFIQLCHQAENVKHACRRLRDFIDEHQPVADKFYYALSQLYLKIGESDAAHRILSKVPSKRAS